MVCGCTSFSSLLLFGGRAFQPLQAIVFSVTVTSLIWAARHGSKAPSSAPGGATWAIALGGRCLADAHSAIAGAGSLVHAGELDVGTWRAGDTGGARQATRR
jgi:hypothetical protein